MSVHDGVALIDRMEALRIHKEMKSQNNISLAVFLLGMLLRIGGAVGMFGAGLGVVLSVVGVVLMIVGLLYYAKSKGRHPAFGLLGFLGCLGLLALYLIESSCRYCKTANKRSANVCVNCYGPVGLKWKESDIPADVFD